MPLKSPQSSTQSKSHLETYFWKFFEIVSKIILIFIITITGAAITCGGNLSLNLGSTTAWFTEIILCFCFGVFIVFFKGKKGAQKYMISIAIFLLSLILFFMITNNSPLNF